MVKIISVEKDVFSGKYILHERLLKYEFALETISPTPFFFAQMIDYLQNCANDACDISNHFELLPSGSINGSISAFVTNRGK